jgi:hypothetical protein
MFEDTMRSIYQNTTRKKNLEIIVIANEADSITIEYATRTIAGYSQHMDCRLLTRPYSEALNRDYYNWGADQSTGDLVWTFADDLVIVAPDWDTVVQREVDSFMAKHPDGIFCVSIRDNTPPPSHRLPKFPCFPMLTRQAIQALGWMLHPKPNNWGVDYINYVIFSGLDRMLNIHDRNYINHISYHTNQVEPDATAIRIGQIFNRTKMIPAHNTDRILQEEVPDIILQTRQKILDWQLANTNQGVQ